MRKKLKGGFIMNQLKEFVEDCLDDYMKKHGASREAAVKRMLDCLVVSYFDDEMTKEDITAIGAYLGFKLDEQKVEAGKALYKAQKERMN